MAPYVSPQAISHLLFLPHVRYIEEVSMLLKEFDVRVEGVHAEDPRRKEKVAAFRKGIFHC